MGRRRRHSHHGHGGGPQRGALFQGEPFGINPGDDIGNRKAKDARPNPPDDIGNRKEDAPDAILPPDDVGNRVDAMPTHDLSGVLTELHSKRGNGHNRPRRARSNTPQVRLGRYVLGGVNPLVSLDQFRAQKAQEQENERRAGAPRERFERGERDDPRGEVRGEARGEMRGEMRGDQRDSFSSERAPRPERGHDPRRDRGPEGAQLSGEQRIARFFDFDEDDRFEYALTSSPEEKRAAAEAVVREIVEGAGRDATVTARVVDDGARPKVLVTIEERGPAASLPAERRGRGAQDPLFVLGNPALMSLNYLVNKIVNRYPGDRIRLTILPSSDLAAYLAAFAAHRARGQAQLGENDDGKSPEPLAISLVSSSEGDDVQAAPFVEEPIVEIPMTPTMADEDDEAPAAARDDDDDDGEDEAPAKPAKKAARATKATKAPRKKATASDDDAPAKPAKKTSTRAKKSDDDAPAQKRKTTRVAVETAVLPSVKSRSKKASD